MGQGAGVRGEPGGRKRVDGDGAGPACPLAPFGCRPRARSGGPSAARHTRAHERMHKDARTHTQTHTETHTRARAHTHARTRTQKPPARNRTHATARAHADDIFSKGATCLAGLGNSELTKKLEAAAAATRCESIADLCRAFAVLVPLMIPLISALLGISECHAAGAHGIDLSGSVAPRHSQQR
jgi:hypothetical protein